MQTVEQRNNATESKDDLPDFSQSGWNTDTAALTPVNHASERKPLDSKTVSDTINAVISATLQEVRAEMPSPAQNAPTAPPTTAERPESTPEGKQPTQGQTAPQKGKLGDMAKLREVLRKRDAENLRKELGNQHDNTDWGLEK